MKSTKSRCYSEGNEAGLQSENAPCDSNDPVLIAISLIQRADFLFRQSLSAKIPVSEYPLRVIGAGFPEYPNRPLRAGRGISARRSYLRLCTSDRARAREAVRRHNCSSKSASG